MAKDRIEYIDTAKGLCIISLVLFHVAMNFDVSGKWLTALSSFWMPLFFFLSGMFFKPSGHFFLKKTDGLFVPFAFWYILSAIIFPFFIVNIANIKSDLFFYEVNIANCFRFYTEELYFNNPIWFLLCLFEMNLIFYAIERLLKRTSLVLITSLLLGLIGYLFGSYLHINIPLYIDTAMTSMPFFYLGYILNRKTQLLRTNKYDKYLPCLIILGAVFVYFAACPATYFRNRFELQNIFNVYSCGMIGSMVVLMFSKLTGKIPLVTYWGRYSIIVLITHDYVKPFFEKLIEFSGVKNTFIAVSTVTICVMLTMCVVIPVLKTLLPHVTAQKQVLSK